ncbi:hypothetical protein [Pseudanabaena sp. PCC 6802]|uniref:hypothetical protein n=1 Tax=Pseudanabaena sp. PCC 6802 TaxID=118173 RepID=UPI00034D0176|nr:hypothetical protein [Pseudanabaena sp. PCC 6802]
MKKQFSLLVIAVMMFSSLAIIPFGFAQPYSGRGGGWRMGNPSWRTYDPATVETIQGEVIGVDTATFGKISGGIHLRVRTQTREEITVHLGPAWYIDNRAVQIQLHDTVEVKGSRTVFGEQPTLIAAEVKKGDRVLTLRDKDGIPVWAGWNRRR